MTTRMHHSHALLKRRPSAVIATALLTLLVCMPCTTATPVRQATSPQPLCTWSTASTGRVVIPVRGPRPNRPAWQVVNREGLNGLRFNAPAQTPPPPPTGTPVTPPKEHTMCFPIRAARAGEYDISTISYAPETSRENRIWVRTSRGVDATQQSEVKRSVPREAWWKAYLNKGGWSDMGQEWNHQRARALITGVRAGELIKLCIAGLSDQFELFALVVTRCESIMCVRDIIEVPRDLDTVKCSLEA